MDGEEKEVVVSADAARYAQFFKSMADMDRAPIVLCALDHTIIYMNKVAIDRYVKRGGNKLLGRSLLDCHPAWARQRIIDVLAWFEQSPDNNIVYEFRNDDENKDVYMVALRDDTGRLIGYYEKHEYRTAETMPLYDGVALH